ncbi:MAG: endonuclease III [Deltaproteobacteria bacterium CG12_big_fil_rev_8_21_14_0_65_43_10]|nr:MAG: endonuclease III [Deltaproteobacteria bacterium CG2_30_43_15]PIQ45392.1 MAG: endonuclease III [Deltaproteobacteria bacterium CG12_big_fil_rev_8_21_14_0_65_43_10]PIU86575.1 MAG: endonuclease III [Deltaproteobacteria bacterium CG06_land_8_20_14_3_00_44_19]PIX25699.1 MAG: endonuclease III [Deltaproteobacteria bacterium CG_4_8_14_3_um_filter_43_13]PIZ19507.1 MAG: endonuclease III [Deltaproteobacteria bacterium CG_4_10_14_0_8_um_filter_43_12]PJB40524.1 MAG: endonuclease III [Deltaproteobact
MEEDNIYQIIELVRNETAKWTPTVAALVAETSRAPFKVLISCILSARTQDKTTIQATKRLFDIADNPEKMLKLKVRKLEEIVYPVGFYRNKAKNILSTCKKLVDEYNCQVPDEIDELLKLPGVGRKTANLVVTKGYGKPGICVDTHVHRICNRLGYVNTKNPQATEFALRVKLPKEFWIEINDLLVSLGQKICRPISPKCTECPIENLCDKVGIRKSQYSPEPITKNGER